MYFAAAPLALLLLCAPARCAPAAAAGSAACLGADGAPCAAGPERAAAGANSSSSSSLISSALGADRVTGSCDSTSGVIAGGSYWPINTANVIGCSSSIYASQTFSVSMSTATSYNNLQACLATGSACSGSSFDPLDLTFCKSIVGLSSFTYYGSCPSDTCCAVFVCRNSLQNCLSMTYTSKFTGADLKLIVKAGIGIGVTVVLAAAGAACACICRRRAQAAREAAEAAAEEEENPEEQELTGSYQQMVMLKGAVIGAKAAGYAMQALS